MNYFRQVYYEMKHQKMMTWVSISGTALAIFLVMTFFMTENVKMVEMAPETDRQKVLVGTGIHVLRFSDSGEQIGSTSAGLSYKMAKELYEGLDGVEKECYYSTWTSPIEISVNNDQPISLIMKSADADYWRFYDFKFLYGGPYDKASCDAGEKVVVLTQSSARKLFKEDNVVGREIKSSGYFNNGTYRVCGVIEDVDPLLSLTFSNIYFPFSKSDMETNNEMGATAVALLPKDDVDIQYLKDQVKGRYATLNSRFSADHKEVVYHDSPWDIEIWSQGTYVTSEDLRPARSKTTTYLIYGLLLILPAINLSSMTKGRLRHRVSEIGVRRAFGAKRKSIVWQLLGENLIITIAGGIIGLVICLLFMNMASSFLFQFSSVKFSTALDLLYSTPSMSMLFTWKNFFFALIMCLALNILSATVPAWRASRLEPAVAIAKSKN